VFACIGECLLILYYTYNTIYCQVVFPKLITGDARRNILSEFNSNNTELLDVEQVKRKLLAFKHVQDEIAAYGGAAA